MISFLCEINQTVPMISVKNLSKIYGQKVVPVEALKDISFEIEAGAFTTIQGPSGSGKSTLLHLLGGLDEPTKGEIWVEGTCLNRLSTSEKATFRLQKIGFVFQDFNLLPVLSAEENVEFILLLQKIPRSQCLARAKSLLQAVGLSDRAHHRPAQCSGGQNQRVAIARALATQPKFILADEPTANLDSKTAEGLLDLMEKLNQEQGTTFIFSSHDPRVIQRGKRILTLEDGRIIHDTKASQPLPTH